MPSGSYKRNAQLVDEWLALNRSPGFSFYPEDVFKHFSKEIFSKDDKNDIMEKLWYGVNKKGNLEKIGRLYKYVNKDIIILDWINAGDKDELPFNWPKSHYEDDTTDFPFKDIIIRPQDIIHITGISNKGKSTFARNLIAENLDTWEGKIQLMVSEHTAGRFKSVLNRMNWVNWVTDDCKSRFRLIHRLQDWKYAIEPDWMNVIDWIALEGDRTFDIRALMQGMQSKLKNGILVVVTQKRSYKTYGEGGEMGRDLTSVYLIINSEVLFVDKVKECKIGGFNPEYHPYGFTISNGGATFSNIHQVKLCPKCGNRNNGTVYDKTSGGYVKCPECYGVGYTEK